MSLLSSNLPINKIKSSYVKDAGLVRNVFNAFTDWLGGPMTEEGINKLEDATARTKQRQKVEKLGVGTVKTLTDEQKEQLQRYNDIRKEIEGTYGSMEEGSLKDEHLTSLADTVNEKAFNRHIAGAGKKDYEALTTDDEKKTFRENWLKDKGIDLSGFAGEGKTVAEKMKNIYGKMNTEIDALNKGSKISDMARLQSIFYDGAELSYGRLAGVAGIGYGAANIVGSGSLGIPFVSTASWNR